LEDYHLERGSAFNKDISLNKMVENLKMQVSNRRKGAKSSIDSGVIQLDNVNNISKFRQDIEKYATSKKPRPDESYII
jgi:hypothetical protein